MTGPLLTAADYPFIGGIASDPNDAPVAHLTHDPVTGLPWPAPTAPEPDFATLAGHLFDAVAEATDGCHPVEPDSTCAHGRSSWLRRLGIP